MSGSHWLQCQWTMKAQSWLLGRGHELRIQNYTCRSCRMLQPVRSFLTKCHRLGSLNDEDLCFHSSEARSLSHSVGCIGSFWDCEEGYSVALSQLLGVASNFCGCLDYRCITWSLSSNSHLFTVVSIYFCRTSSQPVRFTMTLFSNKITFWDTGGLNFSCEFKGETAQNLT